MKLLNFNIIKLTLCLVLGILIAHFAKPPLKSTWVLTTILFVGFTLVFFMVRNKFKQTVLFGVFTFISMLSIGMLVYNLQDEKNNPTHYTHSIDSETVSQTITFQITERLKPGRFHEKYTAEILKLDSLEVSGKVLINITADSLEIPYRTDDIILTVSSLKRMTAPLNPYQFNYKNYLEKQGMYHQLFLESKQLIWLQSKPITLRGYADRLRSHINKKLKEHSFTKEQLALINALLLGQRQEIERTVYENYANAGAVHILAISGLHVGIILLILQFLLKPLERLRRGSAIKTISIIFLLWSFAIVAGLSASVTRAVTMFMIFAIAMNWKRPTNVYNTLAISMFIILLVKPGFLFDVGFQLSYLAVLGIVSVQPMLYKLINKPKLWPVNKLWEITTVTLAAQFGILPLSLYYFHQFPGLFFLSNLAIIPFLGIILSLGLAVIVLAVCNCLYEPLAKLFGAIISSMNSLVAWVSQQESFLIRDIPFGAPEVFASYLLLVSTIIFLKKMNTNTLVSLLVGLVIFQSVFIWRNYSTQPHEFIVFHKSRHSLIGENINGSVHFYDNLDSLQKERIVKDYMVGSYAKTMTEDSIKPIFDVNGKTILIVDSLGVYKVRSHKPDIIVLRNSPKINLNRLIDFLNPSQIVADGSNYKSYVARWEATCSKRKLPFHSTNKKGAFIFK